MSERIYSLAFIRILFCILFQCFAGLCLASHNSIDSLLALCKSDKADTNKVIHSFRLCDEYRQSGNYPVAIEYGDSALKLAQSIKFKSGMVDAYNSIGLVFKDKGDFPKALDNYFSALKIAEAMGSSMAKDTAVNGKRSMAATYGNIGVIYRKQGEYTKALEYYQMAIKLDEELQDKGGLARHLGNIGNIYWNKGESPRALNYYLQALKLLEEIGDKSRIAVQLGNIGSVYFQQNDFAGALSYYLKALQINEELGIKNLIATNLSNIGSTYAAQKKYNEAFTCLYRSLAIADSIGALDDVRYLYSCLSELYENSDIALPDTINGKTLNPEQMRLRALYYHKRFMGYKDLLFNEENKKQLVQKEMTFEFDKREQAIKSEQEKERAVAEANSKRQQIAIWSIAIGLLLVIGFCVYFFRSLRMTRKQKEIIELTSREEEKQRKLLDEQNQDIVDSINYAKRIQEAVLPAKEIKYKIFPDAFVLFQPRELLSGDFYWFSTKNNRRFISAVDCTGHGIPGAFMSMLGNTLLNELVNGKGITNPAEILDQLKVLVVKSLNQTGAAGESRDGMDIAICSFNNDLTEVQFAGANNPLWLIRNGVMQKFPGDKQPIGIETTKPFTNHTIPLQKGDAVYIFTDGYADQFGGKKGRKFMLKQMEQLLLSIHHKPMREQEQLMLDAMNAWQGTLQQVDDILVIGVRA